MPAQIKRFQPAIVSRIKILSNLNIAEKRVPQDGRIKIRVKAAEVDIRVSVIPMLHGEAVVMRLLRQDAGVIGLESLGMHQVFQISHDGRADTAMYVPDDHYLLDYKGHCCLLIAGKLGENEPFDQYSVGNYGIEGKAGTFMPADNSCS